MCRCTQRSCGKNFPIMSRRLAMVRSFRSFASTVTASGQVSIDRHQRLAAQRRQDRRSQQAVLFASPHGDLVSAQHPIARWFACGERGCRTLSDRPCPQGGARRLWQAMDRDAESGDRGDPNPFISVAGQRRDCPERASDVVSLAKAGE
jgi:hypothetical protein